MNTAVSSIWTFNDCHNLPSPSFLLQSQLQLFFQFPRFTQSAQSLLSHSFASFLKTMFCAASLVFLPRHFPFSAVVVVAVAVVAL